MLKATLMKLGLSPLLLAATVAACSGRAPGDLLPPPAPSAATPAAPNDADGTRAPSPALSTTRSGSVSDQTGGAADGGAASNVGADAEADATDAAALDALYAALPIAGSGDAPTVSALSVRCASNRSELDSEPSDAVYPGAFARVVGVTDPQGLTDLAFTTQELVLFAALDGSGAEARTFTVNVLGSSFGGWDLATYFGGEPNVLTTMCTRPWWPAEITLTDASGHVTRSKVRIPIVH